MLYSKVIHVIQTWLWCFVNDKPQVAAYFRSMTTIAVLNRLFYVKSRSGISPVLMHILIYVSLQKVTPAVKHECEPGDGGQRPGYSGYGRIRPHGPFLAGPQWNLHQNSPAPRLCILTTKTESSGYSRLTNLAYSIEITSKQCTSLTFASSR